MTIEEAINSSATMAEAARKVNIPFQTFKRKAIALGLYEPNQSGKGTRKKRLYATKDILEGKHPNFPRGALKARLIKEDYIKYECVWCGIADAWYDKPIVLHLDHINGISNDHRLENLRLLCPNCHSQTDTWCGRTK